MWEWFEHKLGVIGFLGTAHWLEEGMARKARELIEMLLEFENKFIDKNDLVLGYILIIKENDIKVRAVIAHGEEEPEIMVVDVEEWIKGYREAISYEASG
jgi:hypothetical protein